MADPVIDEIPLATCPEKPSVDFSYVGIDAILEQMRRKAMKQGFELNIMVVGECLNQYTSKLNIKSSNLSGPKK